MFSLFLFVKVDCDLWLRLAERVNDGHLFFSINITFILTGKPKIHLTRVIAMFVFSQWSGTDCVTQVCLYSSFSLAKCLSALSLFD